MSWKEKFRALLPGGTKVASAPPAPAPSSDSVTITRPAPPTADAPEPPGWQRRYRFVKILGEGGMGKVLLVERVSDSAPICLKFLHIDTDARIFEQECRALTRLRHPGIVALVDFSFDESPRWMATEYVAGSNLHAFIKENGRLDPESAIDILNPLLEAVAYAHATGVIHRDLKPANIMIDSTGGRRRVLILDFGTAIVDMLDYKGRLYAWRGSPMGTMMYMALEQFRSESLTPACDVYATGLIAWTMVTGREPFEARNNYEFLAQKVARTEPFTLDGTSAPFHPALNAFIEACTRLDPAARPTAAEALAILQSH